MRPVASSHVPHAYISWTVIGEPIPILDTKLFAVDFFAVDIHVVNDVKIIGSFEVSPAVVIGILSIVGPD